MGIPHAALVAAGLSACLALTPAPSDGQAGRRPATVSTPPAPQKFYKEWTMTDLLPSVVDLGPGHDWDQGRELFKKAACGVCHAFASESEGTGLAPDLTGVGSTFTREFVLQSILEPSATINGRFFHT